MKIPQGSFWVHRGNLGNNHVHRVTGVMQLAPANKDEPWQEKQWEFMHPNQCDFHGPEQVLISTWSITPMIQVPLGMDPGVAGWSWLGSLKDFCSQFEPFV